MVKSDCNNNSKFKLIHLLWIVIATVTIAAISWGKVLNQQEVNMIEIDKKLNQEIYDQHVDQQYKQFESLEKTIDRGFKRIDNRLEKMEAK